MGLAGGDLEEIDPDDNDPEVVLPSPKVMIKKKCVGLLRRTVWS